MGTIDGHGEIIQVKDLSVGYGGQPLLEKVSFSVAEGEILVILGPSGCGKTTLLRTMIGLLPSLAGKVIIAGEELGPETDQESLDRLHRSFGVLFQEGALISTLTLGDNVSMLLEEFTNLEPEIIAEMVRVKLAMVGLSAAARQKPSELSGGMLKRAGLARAIALDPRILFCDEPTAGLDPVTATEIDRLLLKLRKLLNVTIVVISHELSSIKNFADRCLMLDREAKGIIAEGTPAELQKSEDPRVHSFFERKIDRSEEGLQ